LQFQFRPHTLLPSGLADDLIMPTDRPNFDNSIADVASTSSAVSLTDWQTPPVPAGHNEPLALLAAWTALEALSPQTFRRAEDLAAGDRSCVAHFSDGRVPWGTGERPRPNCALYYQVVLGSIPLDRATRDLIRAFGEDEERRRREHENAAIATVLVDKDGIVLGGNAIGVSSFAWALPLALKLELNSLGAWTTVEPRLVESLEQILQRVDSDGRPVPLDLQTISKAHEWLVAQFRLPAHLVDSPTFALRVHHHVKAKHPPEPPLLNSFYLGELARAAKLIHQNAAGLGLQRYLGASRPQETFDLLVDKQTLERVIAPSVVPAARWPLPGGHPLVLLQQAAVNVARAELEGSEGIIAVNGPPGTGKTTLLRDLIAQCVLDRALAMASFDDPESAFTPSGPKMAAGDRAFIHLYRLDPRLKGHEIIGPPATTKRSRTSARTFRGLRRLRAQVRSPTSSRSAISYSASGATNDAMSRRLRRSRLRLGD
jgi:hypothetical protein